MGCCDDVKHFILMQIVRKFIFRFKYNFPGCFMVMATWRVRILGAIDQKFVKILRFESFLSSDKPFRDNRKRLIWITRDGNRQKTYKNWVTKY